MKDPIISTRVLLAAALHDGVVLLSRDLLTFGRNECVTSHLLNHSLSCLTMILYIFVFL